MEGLTYNTAAGHMAIPAYGRYVQRMLEHAATLEPEPQQALVERIVRMMAQQFPAEDKLAREDHERKLWRHAYRMADYNLSATPPDGEAPQPEEDHARPAEVPYPKAVKSHRNYGAYVAKMIERARQTQDPQRRSAIAKTVASYMKLAYSTYNDAQNIPDKMILSDLKKMSDGKLDCLGDDVDLDAFMGQGSQSHIKQDVTQFKKKRNKKKKGGNRRRFRKR